MCGVCGMLSPQHSVDETTIRSMTNSLAHRGPDDSDIWLDITHGIGLGHRRLSIIDLSTLGRQPMHSSCGRYVIAYNGEIYNFKQLRDELSVLGHTFRGNSDTEVILATIVQWGLNVAVSRFVGMFAIAIWDRKQHTLSLVRDRLGIKPIYYGWADNRFVFGSELKSLCNCQSFNKTIDRESLRQYFRYGYIPAPRSVYKNARKLEPGTILTISTDRMTTHVERYWSVLDVWNKGACEPFQGSLEDAEEHLERLLEEAVESRMISDVPLGALLSGGIDSSIVVALMQKRRSMPVKTFSIGYNESIYNESQHARAVAEYIGTKHTELFLTPREMLNVIPKIPHYWDEPFADSSQIPTYCVSQLTSDHVTVALSGDGGDELFGGYQRYHWMENWKRLKKIPLQFRKALTPLIKRIPRRAFGIAGSIGFKIRWRLDMLSLTEFNEFYRYFLSHNQHAHQLVLGASEPPCSITTRHNMMFDDLLSQMTLWDAKMYLPDDILTKTDRASMAHGLELRVPLLDHRVVEFAATLPREYKVNNGIGKQVLRNILYKYVPSELVDRPKMGFGVPVAEWLRGDLREWCHDLLSSQRIKEQAYIDAGEVQRILKGFDQGETMWCHHLWDILMFQAWLEEWKC